MGDDRDPNEETIEERSPLDSRRETEREKGEGSAPTSTTQRDLPAVRLLDTDPENLKVVDRSTISESAITEAEALEGGLARLAPLLAAAPAQPSPSSDSTPAKTKRVPSKVPDLSQLTQESAPPPGIIDVYTDPQAKLPGEPTQDEPPPTRKLPTSDAFASLDRMPKGASLPPGVLRRLIDGIDTDVPDVTARSIPREAPQTAKSSTSEEDWTQASGDSATEPMDQDAFVMALKGQVIGTQTYEEETPNGDPRDRGQDIVSLADLVDNEGASGLEVGPQRRLDEESPTTQTRRPRSRFMREFGVEEGSKRVVRKTSQPPRPAVVRAPPGSMPARSVPPPEMDPETEPPAPMKPPMPADVRRDRPMPLFTRSQEPSVDPIPSADPVSADKDGNNRSTVVKPRRKLSPKRVEASTDTRPKSESVAQSPPTAIPIQMADRSITVESNLADPRFARPAQPQASAVADSFIEDSQDSARFRSVLAAVFDEASAVGGLRVISGEAKNQLFALEKSESTVGRGADNDIVLLDLGVSRRHVVIVRHPDGFRLEDADSGNGSFVNGVIVRGAELYDGDIIRLGGTELEYRTQGAPRLRKSSPTARFSKEPRALFVLGALSFVMAFVTMFIVDRVTPTAVEKLAEIGAADWAKRASVAAEGRDWDDAHRALVVSRAFGPHHQQDSLGSRIERETKNARTFDVLRREIAARASIQTLERLLDGLDEESVYRVLAGQRVRAAKKDTLERTIDAAEQDLKKGRSEAARLKIQNVLRQDAAHPRATKLLDGMK